MTTNTVPCINVGRFRSFDKCEAFRVQCSNENHIRICLNVIASSSFFFVCSCILHMQMWDAHLDKLRNVKIELKCCSIYSNQSHPTDVCVHFSMRVFSSLYPNKMWWRMICDILFRHFTLCLPPYISHCLCFSFSFSFSLILYSVVSEF